MASHPYQFYRDFYDNSSHMRILAINNPYKFKIVNCTRPFLEVLGYTKEELLSFRSMKSLYHPDCYEALDQARCLYLKQGFLQNYELILKAKNGKKISVYLNILAVKDYEGNILYNHCLYKNISDCGDKDISKTVKAQQYLESLNKAFIEVQDFYQYFYDFYENAPDMFVSMAGGDIENVGITHCNDTIAQKLGYSKEEILAMNMYDLYHPDCLEETKRMRKHFLIHGYVSNWELQLKKKNGEKIQVSLSSKSKKDSQGCIISSISMWRDITDLVETRRQLQKSNDLLTLQNEEIKTLMHLMSHDIQGPIRGIENFTQFILDESKKVLPTSTLDLLYKVQRNVRKLHYLTRDILSYFFKGSSASIEETNLKDIINQLSVYLDIPSSIKIRLESNIHTFKTKKILLAQVFYNLISNAIKYHHNPDKAEIYVEGVDNNKDLLFIIRDNGPGIPPEFHETVFEPLKRLKAVKEVEGSGMGLAIVRKIITQEGGKIDLESEAGKGATFTFTWPK
ncbi:PAS domain-containing sensor histidine kinase [Candidatus Paracaedibacter symbiosus]|uniref:PAS domain-containing sensor histidine kinase n=1 Tax=Candidatus Paracaedibacter symbiosus TaxID=244582 RepID=UPI0005094325|nr:PAS domain-containing sensor histidine kinase [Candidatus Paracaedibacter symbiosus]